jgi:hypothetical protein
VATELRTLSEEFGRVDPAAVRSHAVADIIVAAGSGELPAAFEAPFIDAQEELRRLSAAQSILSEAQAELAERTPWFAARLSETILADYLRPALEAVLDRVREGAALGPLVPWDDPRRLAAADREVREYHEVVAQANDDYLKIRDAQWRVRALAGAPSDEAYHRFGELRNMRAVWPQRDSGVQSIRGRTPWPDGPARMVWLVTSDAQPWLPTAAECEAANEALVSQNPLQQGGLVSGERGYVAVETGAGLERQRE